MNTLKPINNNDIYEEKRNREQSAGISAESLRARLDAVKSPEKQLPGSQEEMAIAPPIVDVANQPSDAYLAQQEAKKARTMGVIEWGLSPLMALGDAALAPIAAQDYPDAFVPAVGHAFKVSGRALMDRLFPQLGAEAPEDFAATITEREFGDQPQFVKDLLYGSIGALADPSVVLGMGGAKVFQAGLKAKKLQAVGQEARTNKGIWEEGVQKFFGLDSGYDPEALSDIGKMAAKADRGDQEAIEGLHNILEDERLTQRANALDIKATQKQVDVYRKTFGDDKAPFITFDRSKLQRQAMKDGIISNKSPEFAFNINLAKLNTSKDIDALLFETGEVFGEFFEKNKGKMSKADISDGAQRIKLSNLMGRTAGGNLDAKQSYALRQLLVASADTTWRTMRKANLPNASPMDKAAAMQAFKLQLHLQKKASGVAAEWGRTGVSLKMKAGTTRGRYREIQKMLKDESIDDEFMSVMQKLSVDDLDPSQINRLVDKGVRGYATRGYDALYEGYVNAILSGPVTHVTNIVSNTAMLLLRPTQQYLSAVSPAVRSLWAPDQATEAASQLRQANAMMSGIVGGVSDVFKLATGTVRKADVNYPEELEKMHELSKQRVKPAITGENLTKGGRLGSFVDYFGAFVRMPGNALLKEDKAFKLINYRMSINQEAAKHASTMANNSDDVKSIYTALRMNPDESMSKSAVDMSNLFTFTKQFEKEGADKYLGGLEVAFRAPGANLILPFFRTPVNIAKFGVKNSFVGNVVNDLPNVFDSTPKGDLSRARMAIGTLLPVATIGMLGDNVTGHVDQSTAKGRREAAIRPPYSIKVGDKWWSYEKLEPFKSVLGLMVNTKEVFNGLDAEDPDDKVLIDEAAQAVTTAVAQTVGDNSFFEAFGHMHYLLDESTRGNSEGFMKQAEKMVAAMATPNFIAQTNKLAFDDHYRMADSVLENIKKRSWYLSKDMPIYPDAFGDPQHVPRGMGVAFINPFLTRPENNDKIAKEVVELQASIPNTTPKSFMYKTRGMRGKGVEIKLSTEQRSAMGVLIGRGLKTEAGYLPPMRDLLKRKMEDPLWNTLTDDEKRSHISYMYENRRDQVISYLMKADQSLWAQFNTKRIERRLQIQKARTQGVTQ